MVFGSGSGLAEAFRGLDCGILIDGTETEMIGPDTEMAGGSEIEIDGGASTEIKGGGRLETVGGADTHIAGGVTEMVGLSGNTIVGIDTGSTLMIGMCGLWFSWIGGPCEG
jgi:hypothetical protein